MKNGNGQKSRVKGVPQNFGYVHKKCNGSATASEVATSALMANAAARTTATVSAVPRTNKLGKVSGGTQTTNNDFQQSNDDEGCDVFIEKTQLSLLLFCFRSDAVQELLADGRQCSADESIDQRQVCERILCFRTCMNSSLSLNFFLPLNPHAILTNSFSFLFLLSSR
jgi:hypothetical protein